MKNFDYARSLLLTVSSTKQLSKEDVQRKRETVKRLQARLNELDQLYAQDEEEEEPSDEEESISAHQANAPEVEGIRQRNTTTTITAQSTAPQATTTSSSTNRYNSTQHPTPSPDQTSLQSRESRISAHDAEKDTLQSSLLDLAIQLKQSVRGFGASIEAERDTLEATGLGLEKGVGGMEGAGGKMKQLSRETEGAGWFRRMRLYAEVAGLWVLVVLLVFVFPKLRF